MRHIKTDSGLGQASRYDRCVCVFVSVCVCVCVCVSVCVCVCFNADVLRYYYKFPSPSKVFPQWRTCVELLETTIIFFLLQASCTVYRTAGQPARDKRKKSWMLAVTPVYIMFRQIVHMFMHMHIACAYVHMLWASGCVWSQCLKVKAR